MRIRSNSLLAVLLLTAGVASAGPRISAAEAKKIALARVPGTVVHEKLKEKKKNKDGAHDHYNVKIQPRDHAKKDIVRKVEVDAETGQILKIKDVKAKSSND